MSTATKSATSRGERVAIRFSTLSPGSTVRSEFGRCCDPPLTPANALDALAAVVVESSGPATVVVATPPVTVVVAVTGFTYRGRNCRAARCCGSPRAVPNGGDSSRRRAGTRRAGVTGSEISGASRRSRGGGLRRVSGAPGALPHVLRRRRQRLPGRVGLGEVGNHPDEQ